MICSKMKIWLLCIIIGFVKTEYTTQTAELHNETTQQPNITETTQQPNITGIRLVNGNYKWEGRVEIFHANQWGTICDDHFNNNDAKVICAMLGYDRNGNFKAYSTATFGQGNGPIMLDDLECNGGETDISECRSNGWFNHNCYHGEDAGVSCKLPHIGYPRTVLTTVDPNEGGTTEETNTYGYDETTHVLGNQGHIPIRLTNGKQGLVEVYHNGRWGNVCYGYQDYASVCRQLGYGSIGYVTYRIRPQPAILDQLSCPSGYYDDGFDSCKGRFTTTYYCYQLYIRCDDPTTMTMTTKDTPATTDDNSIHVLGYQGHVPIRLPYGSYGLFEVYHNGRWGTVCYNYQSREHFDSVCKYLGYNYAIQVASQDSSAYAILNQLTCPSQTGYYHDGLDSCTGRFTTRYCRNKLYIRCEFSMTTQSTTTLSSENTDARYVSVNCQESNWYIKIRLPPLEQKYADFKESDIYLGSDGCTGYRSGDYLIFNEEYTTCKTNKSTSRNAVIYSNTLVYSVHDPVHNFIVREYRFKFNVECDMSKTENGHNNINQNHGQLDQQTVAGTGHFGVELKFYSDSKYQHEFSGFPPSYMIGDKVYVKVQTHIHDYGVKMRLSDCYTKPTESSGDVYMYYLIKNGCAVDPDAAITSQSSHETRFYFQDFEYANHPDAMYVHCNATFCHINDYSRACEPQCSHRKRKGNSNNIEPTEYNNSGPIEHDNSGPIGYAEVDTVINFLQERPQQLQTGNSKENSNQHGRTGYVIGAVVVAVSMVTILVGVSIYYKRKRRNSTQSKIV